MALLLKIAGASEAGVADCRPPPLAPLDCAADNIGAYSEGATFVDMNPAQN